MRRKKHAVFLNKSVSGKRFAALISGQGSTLQSLLENQACNIKFVVSDKNAMGLKKAHRFGISTLCLKSEFTKLALQQDLKLREKERLELWAQLDEQLSNRRIDGIFLCGFMRVLPAFFVEKWKGRIVNIHPSLLPLYAGKAGIERAIEQGGPYGISLHHVSTEVDAGDLILQKNMNWSESDVVNAKADIRLHYAHAEQNLLREFILRWGQ